MLPKLTEKQRKFVEYYDGNATQAAVNAGYSKKSATITGHENLRKPNIMAAIAARQSKRDSKHIMNREERQALWTSMAADESRDDQVRLRASELLGRSECDFVDRHKIESDKPIEVKFNWQKS